MSVLKKKKKTSKSYGLHQNHIHTHKLYNYFWKGEREELLEKQISIIYNIKEIRWNVSAIYN